MRFTDLATEKVRPVLVIAAEPLDLIVAPVTGHSPRREFEVALQSWRVSGLLGPGSVRCSRLCAIDRSQVQKVVGHVLPKDWERVLAEMKAWFARLLAAADAVDLESLLLADEARGTVRSPRLQRPPRRSAA
ncbi:MAG: type II toxin-antitoxin system PemK/MazF family toxin [Verrucomicrobia bacterium]|nr:type II toxin-antitoxin system PemK/MazF family toxin [Verrucomicrobiota bacterium]